MFAELVSNRADNLAKEGIEERREDKIIIATTLKGVGIEALRISENITILENGGRIIQ